MISTLYSKDSYLNPEVQYLISHIIREYDISKANISILLNEGLITQEQYNYYYYLPGKQRSIEIGWLQRDNEKIKKGLNSNFSKYRQMFFESNQIQDHDILSIKKDAIYIINKICTVKDFGHVHFIEKNTYNSFYRYKHYEFYYLLDKVHNLEVLDIKGISKETVYLHDNYMIDFLKFIFETIETDSIKNAIDYLTRFLYQYNNMQLESGYYRELDSLSKFRFRSSSIISYIADYLSYEDDKYKLDINYNRLFLQYLLQILSNEFLYKGRI